MLLREALRKGLQALAEHHIPSSELAAELLLMHALGCERGYLHAHMEESLSDETTRRYFALVAERLTGKPTQYITGHQEFWGLDFEVTPDVLIPRPETEHVVEAVLKFARGEGAPRLVDVGTGSGCIALALAWELPTASIFAADISPAALGVAQRNAARLGLEKRVEFRESDLLAYFLDRDERGSFDLILSNPPYVAQNELDHVQREVKQFEPRLAWGGLRNGDEVYRRLFPQAQQLLKPGGRVVVEIGYLLRDAVVSLLRSDWAEIVVWPDLNGIPRVVTAQKV
ncbi:MAG: peptide chain release factor N(5)-glutamine methyltransferase [Terriglobia bacterium]